MRTTQTIAIGMVAGDDPLLGASLDRAYKSGAVGLDTTSQEIVKNRGRASLRVRAQLWTNTPVELILDRTSTRLRRRRR